MILKRDISNRIEELRNAIAYSRWTQKHMTVGQGIMCNQEVASWYAVLDVRSENPRYTIPEQIEIQVKQINEIIIQTNWQNPSELI